jgi:hypothetical protein
MWQLLMILIQKAVEALEKCPRKHALEGNIFIIIKYIIYIQYHIDGATGHQNSRVTHTVDAVIRSETLGRQTVGRKDTHHNNVCDSTGTDVHSQHRVRNISTLY